MEEEEERIQGRLIRREEIGWLQGWIDEHWQWSRKRIARELCQRWGWQTLTGKLKDFAARSLLLKLEAQGRLRLPALQLHQRRAPRSAPQWPDWQKPVEWVACLSHLLPVRLEPIVAGTETARRWRFYLDRYHYLGLRVVGENLGYLARDGHGRDVACLLFGAAAWKCAPRERKIQWSLEQRREHLCQVANNTRFLILPWVRVTHLASHVLGQVARRISADWLAKYGHGLDWLETFVERDRFRGSCYRAANWECVGQTQGRSRQDRDHTCRVPIKDVYLYALSRRART